MRVPARARSDALRRLFALRVALPISVLLGAALALLFATTAWTAREQNRYALDASRRLAGGVVRTARDAVERGLVDYAVWDDAARHLVLAFDEAWATENAAWLGQTFGADLAFVVDAEGRTVHGLVDGERVGTAAQDALAGGVGDLLRAARAAPGTAVAGFLATADGEAPALAVAALIIPHTDALARPGGPGSVWLAADRFDAQHLREIGDAYVLPGLRFAPAGADPGEASLPLPGADGRPLGSLAWRPERPGDELLGRLLPPLAVLALALVAAAGLVLRHARRAALLIRASEARAVTDPLTGLANRALLGRRIEEALVRPRQARGAGGEPALLYLDLDGFKAVNDGHGHAAGDELLRLVAARLQACLRDGDTLARVGGDEFVILLPDLPSLAAAVACAERALAALAGPFRVGASELAVGVSVGIAAPAGGDAGPDALLRAADRALYLAKRGGRGTWRLAEGLELDGGARREPRPPDPGGRRMPALPAG